MGGGEGGPNFCITGAASLPEAQPEAREQSAQPRRADSRCPRNP